MDNVEFLTKLGKICLRMSPTHCKTLCPLNFVNEEKR